MIGDINLPCGDCHLCCTNKYLIVTVKKTEECPSCVKLDPYTLTEWQVRKNEKGDCIHLVNGSCEIYHERPNVCRRFDCRYHAAFIDLSRYENPDQRKFMADVLRSSRRMNGRVKQSLARRFNALLR